MPEPNKLTEHLFRRKYGEILSALLRSTGYENFELAEECLQTSFQRALETWSISGIPGNPSGWLYTVARNSFLESLRRKKSEINSLEQIQFDRWVEFKESIDRFTEPDVELDNGLDDLAIMILLCCNPDISPKSQVCLTLKSACGLECRTRR